MKINSYRPKKEIKKPRLFLRKEAYLVNRTMQHPFPNRVKAIELVDKDFTEKAISFEGLY